jgi:hypothetical protein
VRRLEPLSAVDFHFPTPRRSLLGSSIGSGIPVPSGLLCPFFVQLQRGHFRGARRAFGKSSLFSQGLTELVTRRLEVEKRGKFWVPRSRHNKRASCPKVRSAEHAHADVTRARSRGCYRVVAQDHWITLVTPKWSRNSG